MAGSNDNSAPWKIAVAVLVLPLGLLGFGTYEGFKQANLQKAAATDAQSKARDAAGNLQKLDGGVAVLKEVVGFNSAEITDGPTSVVEQLRKSLATNGGAQVQETVDSTLQAMAAEIQRQEAEIASLEENLDERDATLRNIEAAYQNRVDAAKDSQRDSESELQQKIRSSEDKLAAKDDEIKSIQKQLETTQIERENLADTLANLRTEKEREIKNLTRQLVARTAELRGLKDVSFEKSDGLIRTVDAVQGICTVNLGSLDGLKPQTTFSVYKQNNAGIGRGLEDVKGSIEIVRILQPHLAEARILEQNAYDPISPKDPIYSPLWQEGQQEQFVFIGELDINRDGRDDRELLTRVIENAGAKVQFFVNEDGVRVPEDATIDERTKFVVVGKLPKQSDFANRDPRYEAAAKIQQLKVELENEALQYGKRTVSLSDFLSYMGYKPTQRAYRPGDAAGYNLKTGRRPSGQKARPIYESLPKR